VIGCGRGRSGRREVSGAAAPDPCRAEWRRESGGLVPTSPAAATAKWPGPCIVGNPNSEPRENDMTIMDKVIGAITPSETDAARRKARDKASDLARDCPWLAAVLRHHVAIEQAFAGVRAARDPSGRRAAQRWLSTLMTGHALAEEVVLYPAMGLSEQKMHSMLAYTEQSSAKFNLSALETLEPMSQEYLDKLDQLGAVMAHHMHSEEGSWFPALARQARAAERLRLSTRYEEEFNRYMGADADLS
jgi:Hemerythrin HHE cation binding domain